MVIHTDTVSKTVSSTMRHLMAEFKSQQFEPAVPDTNETRYQAQLRVSGHTRLRIRSPVH